MYKPATLVEALEKRALFSITLDSGGLLGITGTTGNDTLSFSRDGTQVNVSLNGVTTALDAAAISAIDIDLSGGDDVASIDPRVIDVDTTVRTGDGADQLTVLGGPKHGALTLIGDNADTLTVTLDGVTDIIRLGDGTIVREGAFSLDPALVYSDFSTLNLIGGTQQDEIVIESVPAGMTVNIETGEGNDVIKIGDSDNNVVASIGSLINLRLGAGSDEVNFDDAAATQSMSYYFNTIWGVHVPGGHYFYADRTDSQRVNLFGAETLRVYTSDAYDDLFTLDEQLWSGAMYIEAGESPGDSDRIEVNFVNQDGMDLLLNDVDPILGNRRTYDFLEEGQSLTLIGYDALDWTTLYAAVVGVDTNGNGVFDWSRDQALEGVLVYADNNANGRLDPGEPTAETDVYGSVQFYAHQAVNLSIVPPAGYTQVTPYQLTGSATPLSIPAVPSPGFVRFLYGTPFLLSPVPSSSEVRGRLFNDRNVDNHFGTGDIALEGVSVWLDLNSNGSLDAGEPTTLTDAYGGFSFGNVRQGEFAIVTPDSIDALIVSHRQGTTSGFLRYNADVEVTIAYAAVRAPGDISGFAYVPFYAEETGRTRRAVGVENLVIFLDANENGSREAGEVWTTTDAAGGYYFTAPGAGTYRIGIELPTRYQGSASWRTVMVVPESHSGEMNFRLVDDQANGIIRPNVRVHSTPTILIGPKDGFYFLDLDEDGSFSEGEPRANAGSGFSGLAHGSYRLSFVCPQLYELYAGFKDGMLIEVGGTPLTPLLEIDRSTGPTNLTIHIYNDTDHNGDHTVGESLLPFPVFIDIDGNGKRDALDIVAIPQPNGTHLFAKLPVGTYTFVVDADAGWIGTQPRDGTWKTAMRVGHYSTEEFAYFLGYQPTPTPTGSITGAVYFDADKDGSRDAGEAGIAGRTVWLDEDNDKIIDDFERVTTTASDGTYLFANLPDGIYKVRQIVPLGWQQTYPSNGYGVNVNVVGGQAAVAASHGVYSSTGPGGSAMAAGWMFFDDDKDGVEDPGESRQSGKIVYIDSNNNGTRDSGEPQVTTNSQGEWSFTNLSPGTYVIRREVPKGYYVSTPILQVTLAADQVMPGLKIGTGQGTPPVTPPPVDPPTDPTDPPTLGSISGYLFFDSNANTIEDTNEDRQSGKTVFLDLDNDGVKDSNEPSTTTNSSGLFTFSDLEPRTYVVRRVVPKGYWVTTPLIQVSLNGQSITNQKIGTAAGSGTQPPPVTDPTDPPPVDPPPVDPPPSTKGKISGFLFNDNDGDGVVDSGEGRASGRVVYIDANNNGKLDAGEKQTTTNTQGIYTFDNLDAGLYRVRRVFPSGWRQSTGMLDINLTTGQVVDDALIGSTARVLIGGQVLRDVNGNGNIDPADTGIANRRVYVDANSNGKYDSGETSTFTNSAGDFEFFDLLAGTYRIRADVPSGWSSTNAALATVTLKSGTTDTTTIFSQQLIA